VDVVIKQREIVFSPLHPEPNQARAASLLLVGVDGVEHVDALETTRLLIRYDIRRITLAIIEDALAEIGFHLDNALLLKLKRALYYYTEETERANLGCRECQRKNTRDIFIQHYLNREHGCRDRRPYHWRNYL
jgi:hypothetical protein